MEEYLVERIELKADRQKQRISSIQYEQKYSTDRLDSLQLASARQQRLVEIQMFIFLRKLIILIVCLILISFFVHSTTNIRAFEQVQHLKSYLADPNTQHMNFYRVSSFDIISSSPFEFS